MRNAHERNVVFGGRYVEAIRRVLPYGGYMKFDGEIVHLGAKDPKTDRPKSRDLIAILKNSFRDLAKNNQCKATALVYNVVVPLVRAKSEERCYSSLS
jgi:hypothetical protein